MKTKSTFNVEIDTARLDVRICSTDAGASIAAPLIRTIFDTETRTIRAIFVDPPAEMRLGDLVATLPPSTPANT